MQQEPCMGIAGLLEVGSRSQLFIDRSLVKKSEGVSYALVQGKKHAAGPWLTSVEPRLNPGPDGVIVLYDSEEKLFKSFNSGSWNWSKDGLHWSQPEANPPHFARIIRMSVVKDSRDPDPKKRYKAFGWGPSAEGTANNPFYYAEFLHEEPSPIGYNTYISPDGKGFVPYSYKPILLGGDIISGYYDVRLELFVAFPKTSSQVLGRLRRCFSVMTSRDFDTWSAPEQIFVPDAMDDEGALRRIEEAQPLLQTLNDPKVIRTDIYHMGSPYQQESCLITFPLVYTPNAPSANGLNTDGPSEIQMAVTRDLKQWHRPFRSPIIQRGKIARGFPNGSDDAFANSEFDTCWFNGGGPGIDVGNEVWLYYRACNTGHAHPYTFRGTPAGTLGKIYHKGIGLVTWQRDRFVSVDAKGASGIIQTIPLNYEGSRLELNSSSSKGGFILVELLDEGENVLGSSAPVEGDSLRHRVVWNGGVDIARFSGKAVSLRFRITNSSLYAFAFRGV